MLHTLMFDVFLTNEPAFEEPELPVWAPHITSVLDSDI